MPYNTQRPDGEPFDFNKEPPKSENITMITGDPNAAAKLSLKIKIAYWENRKESYEMNSKPIHTKYIPMINIINDVINDLTQIQSQIKI